MKKTIKFITIIMALITVLCLSGCSSENGEGSKSSSANKKSESNIKIEDLEWSVDEAIDDGERYVVLTLTNNSKYSIVNFEMQFSEKSNLKQKEKDAYFEDIKELMKIDETDKDDLEDFEELKKEPISMNATSKKLIKKGNTANIKCLYYHGYHYVKNIEHYELVTPDILTLKYVDGEKIRTMYYDYAKKKYTNDTKTEDAFYWTVNAMKDIAIKPEAEVVQKNYSDDDDSFSFTVYGWSLNDFNNYLNICKEAGYTENSYMFDGYYSAENANGYSFSADYSEDDESADIEFEIE